MGSVHDKLKRVRKPRVHLTYDVETGGAAVQRELPFVVGVLGDFSGNPTKPLKSLKERKFVQIDRDNFDSVMASVTPELHFKADNKITNDGSQMQVDLKFNSMEDFNPHNVAQQVEPLRKLLETRNKLTDLLSKVDRSEELEELLENVLQDDEQMKKLAGELGLGGDGGGDGAGDAAPEGGGDA